MVGASLTVYLADTSTLATIFADDGTTVIANPVTTDANGRGHFLIAEGIYDVEVAGTDLTTYKRQGIQCIDFSALPTIFSAGGDLSGSISAQAVIGLQGKGLDAATIGTPSDGYAIVYDATSGKYKAKPTSAGQTYEFAAYIPGIYTDGQLLVRKHFGFSLTFPGNWGRSATYPPSGKPDDNPTATAVITIKKNGSTVGTISIATNGVPTFASSSGNPVTFTNGDYCEMFGQTTHDVTFAGFDFCMVGIKN